MLYHTLAIKQKQSWLLPLWKCQKKLCLQWNDIKENVNSVFEKLRGVWGWSSDGGSQSHLGFLKSILWENTPEEQVPSPFDLPQRVSVKRFCFHSWLPLLRGGKCLPRGSRLFPCHCWRDQTEGSDRTILQWCVRGARKDISNQQRWAKIGLQYQLLAEESQHLML